MLLCHPHSSHTNTLSHPNPTMLYFQQTTVQKSRVHFNEVPPQCFGSILTYLTSVCMSCQTWFILQPFKESCVNVGVNVWWPDSCSFTHSWAVYHFAQEVVPQQARRVSPLYSQLPCDFCSGPHEDLTVVIGLRALRSFPQPRAFSHTMHRSQGWSGGCTLLRSCEIQNQMRTNVLTLNT